MYENPEFKGSCGVQAICRGLQRYNLQETSYETVTLFNILSTTPKTTTEAEKCEKCFSTIKRIKTLLRDVMCLEWRNALASFSVERKLVWCISIKELLISLLLWNRDKQNDRLCYLSSYTHTPSCSIFHKTFKVFFICSCSFLFFTNLCKLLFIHSDSVLQAICSLASIKSCCFLPFSVNWVVAHIFSISAMMTFESRLWL